MTNPYRAMCAELIEAIDSETADWEDIEELKARARALLAQPVAEGPTDEELLRLAREWNSGFESIELHFAADYARAVLARWGRPTPQPETNAFAIVQQRLEQLAGDQELMIYRWPLREDWGIEHTNPSSSVQLGEVSGEYGCTGRTLEEAVCKLAELLPTPKATND